MIQDKGLYYRYYSRFSIGFVFIYCEFILLLTGWSNCSHS